MAADGDKLDCPGNASFPTVSMLDAKLHILNNSTISDAKRAPHLGLDVKNYYLGTPITYFQYMRVRHPCIPQEVWDDPRYAIQIADNGYIYFESRGGFYDLKDTGISIVAFNQLFQS